MVSRLAGVMVELNSASGNMKKSDGQAVDAKNASNPQGSLLHQRIMTPESEAGDHDIRIRGWSESEGVTSTCSWSQILRSRSYALVSQRIRPNLSKETRLEISIQRNETRSLLVEWVAKQIWDISKKSVTGRTGWRVLTSNSYPLRTSECDLVWK